MSGGSSTLAGTGALFRFALRRDRLRLPVWIAVGTFMVVTQSVSSQALYGTPADLAAYRASSAATRRPSRWPAPRSGWTPSPARSPSRSPRPSC